ncbi:hypothetical protein ACFY2H_00620 [Streptomyces griseofuscus]|uniref:hypothetical protein n=1 Tax=Streptomyces griseofuscus TaxID=146922 RepID=UPI0036970FC2
MSVEISDELRELCRHSPWYAEYQFRGEAEQADWDSIAAIRDHAGHFVSSRTHGYNYYDSTEAYARGVSNAEAVIEALEEEDPNQLHWGYGPAETFVYNAKHEPIRRVVADIEGRLAAWPYLNEDRASEIEWDENHPNDHECHAEEGCSCAVSSHECGEQVEGLAYEGAIDLESEEFECPVCLADLPIEKRELEKVRNGIAQRFHDDMKTAGQITVMDIVKGQDA